MLKISHLNKRFDTHPVLQDLNCEVSPGEKVLILGQNGAGKTTLLRCILGIFRPDCGTILVNGTDPIKNRKQALSYLSFTPQLPPPLPFSVRALIDYASLTSGFDKKKIIDFCEKFKFDLNANSDKLFYKLSGGMKQKLLASIAFSRQTPLMLFDEPTANFDPEARDCFAQIIADKEFKDTTMIFISHRTDELDAVLNRHIWLDLGRIVKDEEIA